MNFPEANMDGVFRVFSDLQEALLDFDAIMEPALDNRNRTRAFRKPGGNMIHVGPFGDHLLSEFPTRHGEIRARAKGPGLIDRTHDAMMAFEREFTDAILPRPTAYNFEIHHRARGPVLMVSDVIFLGLPIIRRKVSIETFKVTLSQYADLYHQLDAPPRNSAEQSQKIAALSGRSTWMISPLEDIKSGAKCLEETLYIPTLHRSAAIALRAVWCQICEQGILSGSEINPDFFRLGTVAQVAKHDPEAASTEAKDLLEVFHARPLPGR